jgi:hypothetical protein
MGKYLAAIAALLMVHVSVLLVPQVCKSPPPPLKITVISRGSISYDGRYVWWVQDVLNSPARRKPPLTSNNQDR